MLISPPSVAVLDSAVTYAHDALLRARTSSLDLPTPCADWDLGDLLHHLEDSVTAIDEAAGVGRVELVGSDLQDVGSDPPVDRIILRASSICASWARRLTSAPVAVGDLVLGRDTLVQVGALEIAVHGWDVAEATGRPSPLPEDLAARLYDVALAVVTPDERGRRFGPALEAPPGASAGVRLLAHLGRR